MSTSTTSRSNEKRKTSYIRCCKRFLKKATGRKYGFVEEYRMEDAEYVIVCMNSTAGTAKFTADKLREEGIKAGVLK